jgi:AraC family transcriptional regulator, regulatory protein of adaptative response / DNA-3-methyladenine glycosylase II
VRARVAASVGAFGGVRIPGTLDGFALAVRAILGQQVSVRGATTVMGRLVERYGTPYAGTHPALTRRMPSAAQLATLRTGDIASLGMPGVRADAVLALARAVVAGTVSLAAGSDPETTIRALTALPGIGDWTAHYIAMRALRWPDAFPANDLILRRAAGNLTAAQLLKRADAWRPWRGYAAMHLWRTGALADATSLSSVQVTS